MVIIRTDRLKTYSLLSVALLISSGPLIAANIPAIEKEFPTVNPTHVGLLTTIPSLFVILGILIANRLELWFGKKRTILIGLGVVFLAGVFPVLKHDIFSFLFISRCFFGLGIGLFNRLIIQMISDIFQEDPRRKATVIGLESAFEGLGGICLTLIVGQLLKINWYTSFLIYALALPIFLGFFLFVPDDKKQRAKRKAEPNTTVSDSPDEVGSYGSVIGYGILLFLIVTFFINYNIQITPLLLEKHIGNATIGSNNLAFIGLGAFIAGFSFGRIFQLLKDYIMPVALLLLAISIYITTISESILLTTFCSMTIGFSFRCMMPYLFHTFTQKSEKVAKLGTTMVLVAYNIGATLSPYEGIVFSKLLHVHTVQSLFRSSSIVIFLISIIVWGVVFKKAKMNKVQQRSI
ncbi:Predicted arabinose efflux permease, MFS family [Bacillus sp. OV166]|uniref:MFS transporter n=1 Tax=Bacillus sp. OV166 TaxID=1882763 RepID=UPI000A2AE383|nr:MFS transporter [Bacillus sp. OV166]SMQ81600.1 Predicted arabinose efflux permease, MFS family [Bacillus sp. OV166]